MPHAWCAMSRPSLMPGDRPLEPAVRGLRTAAGASQSCSALASIPMLSRSLFMCRYGGPTETEGMLAGIGAVASCRVGTLLTR